MNYGIPAGLSQVTRAQPIETLPDAQRGVRIDVRPSIAGQGANVANGPWLSNMESNDYVVNIVRQWSAAPGPWDVRSIGIDVQFGAGESLVTTTIADEMPARGLVWHTQAQTVRVIPRLRPGLVASEGSADSVLVWIARGRPALQLIGEQQLTDAPAAIPAFAKAVTVKATSFIPPLPLPVPPAAYLSWTTPGGNVAGLQAIDPTLFFYGQRCLVPPTAAFVSVVMAGGPPNPYGFQALWEVVS